MPKFKLRIFRSCRSKDPSTLPEHPIQRHNIITVDFAQPPPSKQQQPHRSSFKSHVSSAFGCGSKSTDYSDSDYFQWQEDDEWHVVAKIYDVESPRRKIYNSSVSGGDTDDDGFPISLLPLPPVDKKKRRRGRRMRLNKLRNVSASSGDSGLFSSEYSIDERGEIDAERDGDGDGDKEKDETENLISCSRSFSTDSSTDFNPQLETIRESASISLANRYKLKKKRSASTKRNNANRGNRAGSGGMMMMMCRGGGESGTSPEWGSPARLSAFKKLIPCTVEGKMKESFAVVKKSDDPYEDFKRSMMEMIMEKQIFEESDLEQLLQCFLSLNSRFHHAVIVEAFSEIWDTMFCE